MNNLVQYTTSLFGNLNYTHLIGPVCGFAGFMIGVTSVGNIFFRNNYKGERNFTLKHFFAYLRQPFTPRLFAVSWGLIPNIPLEARLKLLNLNWVFMVMFGTVIGEMVRFGIHKIH